MKITYYLYKLKDIEPDSFRIVEEIKTFNKDIHPHKVYLKLPSKEYQELFISTHKLVETNPARNSVENYKREWEDQSPTSRNLFNRIRNKLKNFFKS